MGDSSIALLAAVAIVGYLALQSQKQVELERERTAAAAKRTKGEEIGGAGQTLYDFAVSVADSFN